MAMVYNIPRIIWITGNYSTTVKIPREHKRLVGDPSHHSHRFVLAAVQNRNALPDLAELSVKLIGEVPIQVDMIGVFSAREIVLGLTFTLLIHEKRLKTTRNLVSQLQLGILPVNSRNRPDSWRASDKCRSGSPIGWYDRPYRSGPEDIGRGW